VRPPSSPRRVYEPPTDPNAELDEVQQALVRMFIKILTREIREGAAWWTDDDDVAIVDADEPERRGRTTDVD
jgi:hypothetical protein